MLVVSSELSRLFEGLFHTNQAGGQLFKVNQHFTVCVTRPCLDYLRYGLGRPVLPNRCLLVYYSGRTPPPVCLIRLLISAGYTDADRWEESIPLS